MTGDSRCTVLSEADELLDEILKNNIKEILNINIENFDKKSIYNDNRIRQK